jgi:hypothetical protein
MRYPRIALLLVSTLSVLAWGQNPTPQQAAVQRMEKMSQALQLTEPQKEKIMPILVEEAPKLNAVKSDTTLPQNEKLAKLMEIRNETNDKIRPILSPTQQQKLDQMRQQQRQQMMQQMSKSPK